MMWRSRETEAGQKHHFDIVKYTQKTLSGFSFLYFNHCITAPFPRVKKRNTKFPISPGMILCPGFGIWIWMQQVWSEPKLQS